MTRVLFVDDDEGVLRALERSMRMRRREWSFAFVADGAKALAVLAQDPFDVIVSDIAMPEMDGVTLLGHVRAQFPAVARLALSGEARLEQRMRAIHIVHQWLAKPSPIAKIVETLDGVVWARELVHDPALLAQVSALAVSPTAASVRDLNTLAQHTAPTATDDAIVALLERDVLLAGKLVQLASTAFFGDADRFTTLRDAVTRFVTQQLRELVGELGSTGHPLRIAGEVDRDAKLVGELAHLSAREPAARLAGLLHGIGTLVLRELAPGEPASGDVVRAARVGGLLLGLWGLPREIVSAVAFHRDPESAPDPAEPILLAVARARARVADRGDHVGGEPR